MREGIVKVAAEAVEFRTLAVSPEVTSQVLAAAQDTAIAEVAAS